MIRVLVNPTAIVMEETVIKVLVNPTATAKEGIVIRVLVNPTAFALMKFAKGVVQETT